MGLRHAFYTFIAYGFVDLFHSWMIRGYEQNAACIFSGSFTTNP